MPVYPTPTPMPLLGSMGPWEWQQVGTGFSEVSERGPVKPRVQ